MRARFGLESEQLLPVEGLPCLESEDADRLVAFDAGRLFVRCVPRLDPNFQPAADTPHVSVGALLARVAAGIDSEG